MPPAPTHPTPTPAPASKIKTDVATRLWAIQSALDLWQRVSNATSPQFNHVISVSVTGGPGSDLRRIWFLAVSAAFGRYRNACDGYQSSTIEAEWHVTDKRATVTIAYGNSGLVASTLDDIGGLETSGLRLLQEGPTQVTIGAGWPGWLVSATGLVGPAAPQQFFPALPGGRPIPPAGLGQLNGVNAAAIIRTINCDEPAYAITPLIQPNSGDDTLLRELATFSFGGQQISWRSLGYAFNAAGNLIVAAGSPAPTLPDDGRIITTAAKNDARVQNPRPPVDGLSRGGLCSLVAQVLQTPCYSVTKPPCYPTNGEQPILAQGVYVYAPGNNVKQTDLGAFVSAFEPKPLPGALVNVGPAFTTGPDGYPLAPDGNVVPTVRGS